MLCQYVAGACNNAYSVFTYNCYNYAQFLFLLLRGLKIINMLYFTIK